MGKEDEDKGARERAVEDFDKGLKELEGIVERLDRGELSLEDSLEVFENGIKLVRKLTRRLEEAQKRIEVLTEDEDGKMKLEPFKGDEKK
jgi:exodeoxyribonuclease VII small subunit